MIIVIRYCDAFGCVSCWRGTSSVMSKDRSAEHYAAAKCEDCGDCDPEDCDSDACDYDGGFARPINALSTETLPTIAMPINTIMTKVRDCRRLRCRMRSKVSCGCFRWLSASSLTIAVILRRLDHTFLHLLSDFRYFRPRRIVKSRSGLDIRMGCVMMMSCYNWRRLTGLEDIRVTNVTVPFLYFDECYGANLLRKCGRLPWSNWPCFSIPSSLIWKRCSLSEPRSRHEWVKQLESLSPQSMSEGLVHGLMTNFDVILTETSRRSWTVTFSKMGCLHVL